MKVFTKEEKQNYFSGAKEEESSSWFYFKALEDPLKTSYWLRWAVIALGSYPSPHPTPVRYLHSTFHLDLKYIPPHTCTNGIWILDHTCCFCSYLSSICRVSDLKEKMVYLEWRYIVTGKLLDPFVVLGSLIPPVTRVGVLSFPE